MVLVNEFGSVFKEFGLTNIVFLIKNNPHPTDNSSREYGDGIDLADLNTNNDEVSTIDDAFIEQGSLTYNNTQNIKDKKYDIEIIIKTYDKRLSNGKCLVLLYNKTEKKYTQ